MKSFSKLNKEEIEKLRKKSLAVPAGHPGVNYDFGTAEIQCARNHLKTLYTGKIREPFIVKLLLLNQLY